MSNNNNSNTDLSEIFDQSQTDGFIESQVTDNEHSVSYSFLSSADTSLLDINSSQGFTEGSVDKKRKNEAWYKTAELGITFIKDGVKKIRCMYRHCNRVFNINRSSTSTFNGHLTGFHKLTRDNYAIAPMKIFGVTVKSLSENDNVNYTEYFHKSVARYFLKHSTPFAQLDSPEF